MLGRFVWAWVSFGAAATAAPASAVAMKSRRLSGMAANLKLAIADWQLPIGQKAEGRRQKAARFTRITQISQTARSDRTDSQEVHRRRHAI